MKKILGTVLLGTILVSSNTVSANNMLVLDNSNMLETKIKLNGNKENVKEIYLLRKGEKINLDKKDKKNLVFNDNDYYISEDSNIYIGALMDKDIIVLKDNGGEYYYQYNKGKDKNLKEVENKSIKKYESLDKDIYNLNIKYGKDFFNSYVKLSNVDDFKKFDGIYLNDNKLEKIESKYSVDGNKYFIENDKLYLKLNDRDKITFKKDNKIIGIYSYHKDDKIVPVKEKDSKVEIENKSEINDEIKNDKENVENKIEENKSNIRDFKIEEKNAGFDNYLVIKPRDIVKEIDSINIDGLTLKKVENKITIDRPSKYCLDSEKGYIYLNQFPGKNSKIVIKNKSGVIGAFIKKADNLYEKTDNIEHKQKDLKLKISGEFESAIVGQKKYDAISSATGSVSNNTNSNVKVYVAETNNTEPTDNDWKMVKDTNIKLVSNSKYKSRAIIEPSDSGMVAAYNPFESSLTLQGVPKKEGEYSIHLEATDNLGRKAVSNELKFRIFSLDNVKLENQLKVKNFHKFEFGNEYKWDMEPWSIIKFGGKEETVTVPKELNVWFGSHESGKYGYLGQGIFKNVIPPKQKLIIDKDTKLTLVNMQILSSVDVIVKDGGKLNLNDCSIYGKIIVENDGILQVNYNEHEKKATTGTSINGQIIIKDGGILDNSSIYSNANNLTDGDRAKKIVTPVVEVQGDAIFKGRNFIRGDEAPTGIDPLTGVEYKGQNALTVKNGSISLDEGSILCTYGGGTDSTTTNGGDAIILNNGKINGAGTLVAVGGTSGGFNKNSKAGDAVSGVGNIDINKVYLQGGYSSVKNEDSYGKGATENINISNTTKGSIKNGNSLKSINATVPPEYWNGTIAPGNDKNKNPLENIVIPETIAEKPKVKEASKDVEEPKTEKEPKAEEKLKSKENTNILKINKKAKKQKRVIEENKLIENKVEKIKENKTVKKEEKSIINFKDIVNHWANNVINYVAETGYFTGISKDEFRPDDKLTRGQLVTVLGRYFKGSSSKTSALKDVKEGEYYSEYINWAVENGIISGYEDGTFKADKAITREEVAVILDRASKKMSIKEKSSSLKIEDIKDKEKISLWAKDSVKNAIEKGWLKGDNKMNYNPSKTLTRAELAQIIYNIDK